MGHHTNYGWSRGNQPSSCSCPSAPSRDIPFPESPKGPRRRGSPIRRIRIFYRTASSARVSPGSSPWPHRKSEALVAGPRTSWQAAVSIHTHRTPTDSLVCLESTPSRGKTTPPHPHSFDLSSTVGRGWRPRERLRVKLASAWLCLRAYRSKSVCVCVCVCCNLSLRRSMKNYS